MHYLVFKRAFNVYLTSFTVTFWMALQCVSSPQELVMDQKRREARFRRWQKRSKPKHVHIACIQNDFLTFDKLEAENI